MKNGAMIELDDLTKQPKNKDLLESGFVALADVPDIIWKNYPFPHLNKKGEDIGVVGGRDTISPGVSDNRTAARAVGAGFGKPG